MTDHGDHHGDHHGDQDGEPMELVMPFLNVTSRGGTFADEPYAAGWEMGAFDALLSLARPATVEVTIHTDNLPQADLIAMKAGYRVDKAIASEGVPEWSQFAVSRCTEPLTAGEE
jgi:hypothetical protein